MPTAGALVGGNRSNALNDGPFYVNLNNPLSNSNANIGARLAFLIVNTFLVILKRMIGTDILSPC